MSFFYMTTVTAKWLKIVCHAANQTLILHGLSEIKTKGREILNPYKEPVFSSQDAQDLHRNRSPFVLGFVDKWREGQSAESGGLGRK